MRSLPLRALAGAAAIMTMAGPVLAAERLPPAPVFPDIAESAPADIGSGWYLRGDIGYVDPNQVKEGRIGEATPPFDILRVEETWSVGVGAGYRFTDWLRADVTVDHRFDADLLARNSGSGYTRGYSTETASLGVTTGLVNVYADLGTWYGITPYVGAGVGVSRTEIRDYVSRITFLDGTYAAPFSYQGKVTNQLAWALMAGIAVDLSQGFKLDLGYRYVHLGEAQTKLDRFNVGTKIEEIDAHELRVGLRWEFAAPLAVAATRPIVARN